MSIFRNSRQRELILDWERRFRKRISVPVEDITVTTTFGRTYALMAGPKDAPPLVILHGALATSSHVMPELGSLLETRRIYALDVIGQSVMSEDRRMELADGSYGRWVGEACDGLGLREFDLYGVSWGGFVALQAAAAFPARLRHLILLVPAGIVGNSVWAGMRDAGLPMMLYRLFPSETRFRRVMRAFFTDLDPDWNAFFRDALNAYRTDIRVPPLVQPKALEGVRCPVLVFGAEHDVNFPGAALLQRAKEIFPQAEVELLKGSQHCPPFSAQFRAKMAERIERFLASSASPVLTPP